jgi:outer membrane lipoprotein carrier protein
VRAHALALCLALLPLSLPAATPVETLAARLQQLAQLSGRFEQTVSGASRAVPAESAGRFSLVRPDRFRWEVTTPDSQLLVARGEVLWHYDRDLETATERRLDADGATAPLLLLGADAALLARRFAVSRVDDSAWRLEPVAPEAGFSEALIRFEGELPVLMRVVDRLGQTITIRFSELSRAPLDDALFRFDPPAGVEVYREQEPGR